MYNNGVAKNHTNIFDGFKSRYIFQLLQGMQKYQVYLKKKYQK